jgi:hypothetical protein
MAYYSTAHPPRSSRDHFIEPPSILERFFVALPSGLVVLLQKILEGAKYTFRNSDTFRVPRTWQEAKHRFNPKGLLNLPNALIILWIIVLLWGERWVFEGSINACQWTNWERWVSLPLYAKLRIATYTKQFIATDSDTPPLNICSRSAIDRPAYVSRSAMAAINAHSFTYRQLSQTVLHPAPEISASGYSHFSWGPF